MKIRPILAALALVAASLQASETDEFLSSPPVKALLTLPWTKAAAELLPGFKPASLLDRNIVVAFYGNPRSKRMGILGENDIETTAKNLKKLCEEYRLSTGDMGVVPAFHLIYATCYADGTVGVLSDKIVQQYIDYAADYGFIVVLDHQIGKGDTIAAVKSMLRWLDYPQVHLAIDPEWKTDKPGLEIGQIRGEDVNTAQQLMEDYLESKGIEDRRMLVVHQFKTKMIRNASVIKTNFNQVDLIHHADGFGPPSLKLDTYAVMAKITSMPVKGFKVFFPKSWKIRGFDSPMFNPAQVMSLTPKPVYISYQ